MVCLLYLHWNWFSQDIEVFNCCVENISSQEINRFCFHIPTCVDGRQLRFVSTAGATKTKRVVCVYRCILWIVLELFFFMLSLSIPYDI